MLRCQTARVQVSDGVAKALDAIKPKHSDANMEHIASFPAAKYELCDVGEIGCGVYRENDSEPIAIFPGPRTRYDVTNDLRGVHVFRKKSSGTQDARTPSGIPSLAEINRRNREFYKRK